VHGGTAEVRSQARVRGALQTMSHLHLHRVKTREKMLEQALAKLAGENWQVCILLDM